MQIAGAAAIVIGAGAAMVMAKTGGSGLLLVALAGGWLFVSGWQGRRVGEEPRCARCGYILLHLASFHCPECGTEISMGNTVTGEHRRGWGRMIAGVVLLMVASLLMMPSVSKSVGAIPWYQYKPAGFVLDDLDAPGMYRKAMTELQRRESAGELSENIQRRLVEKALEEQAPANLAPRPELLDYLEMALVAGRLTDQEKERFLEQACQVTMTVRPVVAEGKEAAVRIRLTCRGPRIRAHPRGLWIEHWEGNYRIDGNVMHRGESRGVSSFAGTSGSEILMPAGEIGKHTIEAEVSWTVWNGTLGDRAKSKLIGTRSTRVRATYQVVPGEEAPKIELLDSGSLRAQVVAALKMERWPECGTAIPVQHMAETTSMKRRDI